MVRRAQQRETRSEMSASPPSRSSGWSAILPDAPDADRLLGERERGGATRSARSIRSAGTRSSTSTPTPRPRSGDLLEDRRLGPRLGVGPARLAAADPAEGGRRDGRRAEVGRRLHAMALLDYGWPERALDLERTAVVLGNAMAGEQHYLTALRVAWPELARELGGAELRGAARRGAPGDRRGDARGPPGERLPPVTEDTMPGELGNCLAGRVANLFNLRGPNFVVDAACASAMAAMDASIEGLIEGEFDAVVTGGIDRNMGASTFVKFCAIGALSATGTRPYADGADGFVMGEGRRSSCSSAWPTPSATATASTR